MAQCSTQHWFMLFWQILIHQRGGKYCKNPFDTLRMCYHLTRPTARAKKKVSSRGERLRVIVLGMPSLGSFLCTTRKRLAQ
jgi:hypothetical protein